MPNYSIMHTLELTAILDTILDYTWHSLQMIIRGTGQDRVPGPFTEHLSFLY